MVKNHKSVKKVSKDLGLSSVMKKHPRIMATSDDFEQIKREITTNAKKSAWYKGLISKADSLVKDPTPIEYELTDGIRGLEYSVKNYAPDGVWYEGPAYSALSMEYFGYMFAALETATGKLYGFDAVEGIDKAAQFLLYIQSPMGSFELTESGAPTAIAYTSVFLWFTNYFDNDSLVSNLYSSLSGKISDTEALALLWYDV